jgi:hypothetical protein
VETDLNKELGKKKKKKKKNKKKKKKKCVFSFFFNVFTVRLKGGRFYRSMFPDTTDRFLVFAKRKVAQTMQIPKLSPKLAQTKQSQRPFVNQRK